MNEGKREGKGIQKWPDGRVYEGEWFQNLAHGKGKLIYPNGDVYYGDFVYNFKEGYGT